MTEAWLKTTQKSSLQIEGNSTSNTPPRSLWKTSSLSKPNKASLKWVFHEIEGAAEWTDSSGFTQALRLKKKRIRFRLCSKSCIPFLIPPLWLRTGRWKRTFQKSFVLEMERIHGVRQLSTLVSFWWRHHQSSTVHFEICKAFWQLRSLIYIESVLTRTSEIILNIVISRRPIRTTGECARLRDLFKLRQVSGTLTGEHQTDEM